MARPTNTSKAPEVQHQEEEIPPFQSIAPSIFVPAQADFTKPPPDQPSELPKLRGEALARIDEHADAVQDNIYYMLDREKTRIRQECWQREARFPARLREATGLTLAEEKRLPNDPKAMDVVLFIRSICPEPELGPYEVPPVFTHGQCLHVQTGGRFGETPRKAAEKMMLNLAKHGVQNLEGLAYHTQGVKENRKRELDNEILARTLDSMGIPSADRMDIG
ncbi:hypothetical protein GGR54DRAFT_309495 [Hypoxylon sp. NC1633]|nr:hypothetical protein GGR54DRAFT_309495 [Hypoxylon sp. NC1633]